MPGQPGGGPGAQESEFHALIVSRPGAAGALRSLREVTPPRVISRLGCGADIK
ncbi:hypothetical protein GCM10010246_64820 [Streptomyces cuspidosporus]|uniref:Uncharacterized protein n=1 Tax=Streptomyces cuspidosporus TaxID=66882 RepID=A0ABP5TX99_9ACTN